MLAETMDGHSGVQLTAVVRRRDWDGVALCDVVVGHWVFVLGFWGTLEGKLRTCCRSGLCSLTRGYRRGRVDLVVCLFVYKACAGQF